MWVMPKNLSEKWHLFRKEALCFGRRLAHKLLPQQKIMLDRTEVITYVGNEGRMTSRFSFMVLVSCGVATMGLLQSSPAVVIGAMLISPLMSPIMALGFGLCVMDFRLLRKSLEALLIGTIMAIAVSFILVKLSPLNDPTPEIIARTRPNLLDLVVAVFSALAGGYAVIKRKGETLVGVAIATALMPPLAVVGYGLATGKMDIASGSFFLFMTNLLAIALTVTLLAVWYGFSYQHGKHYGKWQVAIVFMVFAVLSIPLGSSLKRIVYEAGATRTAKTVINDYFSNRDEPARIESFRIAFDTEHGIYIDTVILTKQYDTEARNDILELLQPALKRDVKFALDQLVVSQDPNSVKALSLQMPQNTLSVPVTTSDNAGGNASVDSLAMLRAALPVPADIAPATDAPSVFIIHPKPVKGGNIGLFRSMEQQLSGQFSSLNIRLVPPVSRLPDIRFSTGEETPNENGMEALEDSLWALRRWEIQDVQVVGFASTLGEQDEFDNKLLAQRRAIVITERLKEAGVNAVIKSEYQTFEQRESEKRQGMRDFQKVEIRLVPTQPESIDSKKVP